METAILLLIAVVITAVIATDIERKRKFATFVDTAQELAALKLDHSRLRERYTRLADVVTAANAVRDGTGMPPSPLTTRNPKPDLTPGSLMYDPEPRPWVVLFENPDLTVDFVVTYAMDKADAIEWGTLHASKMAPGTHCVGANPNLDAVLCTQFDSAATLSNFRDGRF